MQCNAIFRSEYTVCWSAKPNLWGFWVLLVLLHKTSCCLSGNHPCQKCLTHNGGCNPDSHSRLEVPVWQYILLSTQTVWISQWQYGNGWWQSDNYTGKEKDLTWPEVTSFKHPGGMGKVLWWQVLPFPQGNIHLVLGNSPGAKWQFLFLLKKKLTCMPKL